VGSTVSMADPINNIGQVREEESAKSEEPSLIDWQIIWKPLGAVAGLFLIIFFLPMDSTRFTGAVIESLALAKWYAREHVLLCLVPAFFIAGAISVFVSQAAVMKYLGAGAMKIMSYGVASVSGSILAVCSCYCRFLPASGSAGPGSDQPLPFFIQVRPSTCWPLFLRPVFWALKSVLRGPWEPSFSVL